MKLKQIYKHYIHLKIIMSIHDLFFFPISTRTHHLRWLPNRELDGTPWRWRVSLGALLLMERVFCLNKCTLLYTGVINVKQCKSTVDLTKFPCHIALLCIVPVGNTMTPVIWVVLGVLSDIICNVVIYIPCPEIIWKLSDDRWGHFFDHKIGEVLWFSNAIQVFNVWHSMILIYT